MARKRFNRNAICRAEGNSGIYEASHKAHETALNENHKDTKNTMFLMLETNASKVEVILDDSEITISVWGKPIKIQYKIAKAAGLIK